MLSLPELVEWIERRATFDLVRLETLPHYTSASDGADLERFRRDPLARPTVDKAGWLQTLRGARDAGTPWRRIRMVHTPMTDYELYACHWGYPDNVANGEDVRVLVDGGDLALDQLVGDLFVADRVHVVRHVYDGVGRLVGARVVEDREVAAQLIAVTNTAWKAAAPFADWWAGRPENLQARRAA